MSPTEIVRDAYDAFARRDVARIFSLLSPEIEIVQSAALPWGGTFRGLAGAQQFFTKLTSTIHSTVTLERLIDSGDFVTAVGWTEGTVNASGAGYRVPLAHVWHISGGRVDRIHFMIDHPAMLAALGQPSKAAG